MACPVPPSLSTLPSLSELVAQLAALDPVEAERRRPKVVEVEKRLATARAQLAADEAALGDVKPDGTDATAAYDEWCLRSQAAFGSRRAVRLLGIDEGVLREMLERALFLARQNHAKGRAPCSTCQGTGEGEPIDAGTSVDWPPCTGNSRVRCLLIQAVHSLLRMRKPETAHLREWAERITARCGKKIAVVALARRLAGILFAMMRDGTQYRGVMPQEEKSAA